ncbi:MAG: inosine/xanthosine triphosphatase [Candidatus Bipolaricaulia bacterium]
MITINVGSDNPVKARAVENVFTRFRGPVTVQQVDVPSGVSEQPFDEETVRGAIQRAEHALGDADYGVGIESGLIWNPVVESYFDVQFCAIVDRDGELSIGHGSGFIYPPQVIEAVLRGRTIGEVMDELTGVEALGEKQGAIGYLSKGRLTRTELTEQAVLAALIPRITPELYND